MPGDNVIYELVPCSGEDLKDNGYCLLKALFASPLSYPDKAQFKPLKAHFRSIKLAFRHIINPMQKTQRIITPKNFLKKSP